MNYIIRLKLKYLSKLVLRKYRPAVIGVTGSIGKSSAKEAIYSVLHEKKNVRKSRKNYNNEIGVPLTIIGADSPGRNIFGWMSIFLSAWKLILWRDKVYPEILILEMGVDRPGDMAYLASIAKPEVGVVTAVSYSHLEYFGSIVDIKKEKQVLIENVDNKGLVILNFDNDGTKEMIGASRTRVLTYGLRPGATLQAQDVIFNFSKGDYEMAGINFKLNYNGAVVPVMMANVLTESALYAALAGAAVGIYFDLNLVEIAHALKYFALPPGRMNILPGIKHTFIIDDTYNSSPEAAIAAVDILGRIKIDETAKKYAVMGDMLELGVYTVEGHRSVGEKIAKSGVSVLLAVGERAREIIRGAMAAGFSDLNIYHFDHSEEAGKFLQERIKDGDLILIKGSQGMRMEKAVKEIMAEPERAAELLVRQGEEWQKK